MNAGQIGGRIGPFQDPATGASTSGRAFGSFTYLCQGDPNAVLPELQSKLSHAVNTVVVEKLVTGQVAVPTLQQSLPYFWAEIIAASGAAEMGVQIGELNLTVTMDQPSTAQPAAAPMPPTPMQATADAFTQAAQDELDPRNYEYEAQVNVGGFKIKGSTDGGLDTDGLAEQAKDKAKSTLIWWGAGCVIIGIILIGLAGLGWWIYGQYMASAPTSGAKPATGKADTAKWDGKKGFTCGGNKHLRIKGVKAKLGSGTAINAGGNCRLELVDVTITAPTAIKAGANAVVTVKGGAVTGKQFAAKALGNSKIEFSGTKVTGKKQALGAAKITGP